jgi:hypothetical protein
MTYNHPKHDNCDRGSHPVLNVRMCMYVHYYLHKMFHVEHCTYNCYTGIGSFWLGYRQRRLMSEATYRRRIRYRC